jgi:ketosteroid isomerase-like protein
VSAENVEVVTQAIDAFNRHDIDALRSLSADDFEFVSVLTAVDADGATYRGIRAWDDYFAVMDETWTDWRVEDFRLVDGGKDKLAGTFRIVGTGKLSGAGVDRAVGITYELRDGKLWRMRSYMNPPDAVTAIRLTE